LIWRSAASWELDRLGLAENTLVVFTTDHGHFLGQHGLIAKGAFHYDDLLRIPMLVRAPARIAAAGYQARCKARWISPTFLARPASCAGHYAGVNQLDVWQGKEAQVRDWRWLRIATTAIPSICAPSSLERYKITVYRNAEYGELFDLVADPGEHRNRWTTPSTGREGRLAPAVRPGGDPTGTHPDAAHCGA